MGRHGAWGASSGLAGLVLLSMTLLFVSCGGAGSAGLPGGGALPDGASTDARLLPLGSPIPPIPAQVGAGDRAASQSEAPPAGGTLDFPGAVFLNAAGGTVEGDTLLLQSSEGEPAWAMYKADGLAGLKIDAFGVETIPGDLETQYSVGLSNFSDGQWDYFINTALPEVEIDLSDNTKRLVSHLGNLYWVVVVSGGDSVRVVAGHVFTGLEGEDDWCPEQVTGLTASQGLEDRIHLEWNARDCARKYEVWGRRSPDQGAREASCWTVGNTDWVLLAKTEANSYDELDAEAGVWVDFKVRAKNHCGLGGFSTPASGYMGSLPGGDGEPVECDAAGVIASLDDTGLTLEDGSAFLLTEDTVWRLEDGGGAGREQFAVGDKVAVDGAASADGPCTALTVTMLEKGGDPVLFDAESVIALRADGVLQLQNGMAFAWNDATAWLDADGNPAPLDAFQPQTGVHVWGSILGMGPALALKVQLLPPDPAG